MINVTKIIKIKGILKIYYLLPLQFLKEVLNCSVSTFLGPLKFFYLHHPYLIHWIKHFLFNYLVCSIVLISYFIEAENVGNISKEIQHT